MSLNKITLPLFILVVSVLFFPTLTQAEETYSTGGIASQQAADQRAALKAKAEKRKARKLAEAKKAGGAENAPEATAAGAEAPKGKSSAPVETGPGE